MESIRYILTGQQCSNVRADEHKYYMRYLYDKIPKIIQERGGGDLNNSYRKVHEVYHNLWRIIRDRNKSYRKQTKAEDQYARDWWKLLTGVELY